MVISTEAASVDNANHLDYLTSKVVFQEPQIESTDRNIKIDNNCIDDKLHFGMPCGSRDYENEGDKTDAIPTASQQPRAVTELERFHQGSSDVDRYESEDGDAADVDEQEESSQADDGSTQNVQD